MVRFLSTSKLAHSGEIRAYRGQCVASVPEFQTSLPCKTKRPAVGEAWSGRTSPSGSAPWGSPPARLGGFLFRPHARAGSAPITRAHKSPSRKAVPSPGHDREGSCPAVPGEEGQREVWLSR